MKQKKLKKTKTCKTAKRTKVPKVKKAKKTVKKVSANYSGTCQLNQLPSNRCTYFKLVKKDGSLSKKVYVKDKGSWNPFSKKYDICSADDCTSSGREMSGKTKVSTRFIY